jgi:thymidine kinase
MEAYQAALANQEQRGRIELIIGCMFAGKSTELLRRVRKHEITGKSVLNVKFSADQRYDKERCEIVTHCGQKRSATAVILLKHLGPVWEKYDVIGIDEGQFFPDIVEFAEIFANAGKIVVISSLGGTFLRGPFKRILELIPKCEKIKKLSAICKLCK